MEPLLFKSKESSKFKGSQELENNKLYAHYISLDVYQLVEDSSMLAEVTSS